MKKRIKVPLLPGVPKVSFRRFSEKEQVKQTIGQAPGTLVYTGSKNTEAVSVEIFSYNKNSLIEKEDTLPDKILPLFQEKNVNWINVSGLHDIDIINKVGDQFKLHTLLLEDVLHVDQRPKTEDFGNYLFFTIKMFHQMNEDGIEYEHVSFVLGKNVVLSFQEKPKDIFNLLRDRLRNSYGKIRHKGADYLFYRFIDTIIDNYFLVLDKIAEKIEALEDEVMDNPSTKTLQKLQVIRKELIYLRRSIYPLRESINSILKSETPLVNQETERFFTDVYDHTIQVIESLETYRDLLAGIMDLYMNTASNRMNEIMKVLTIMSTIFIPLTFIAGIYGMNFENMPELSYEWSYPIAWGVMIVVAIAMLFLFKKKNWL